jgi:hypothetical protein
MMLAKSPIPLNPSKSLRTKNIEALIADGGVGCPPTASVRSTPNYPVASKGDSAVLDNH